jgi:hypothetical protein
MTQFWTKNLPFIRHCFLRCKMISNCKIKLVDSGPKSLIYFSTDVESVLMSETEKSCWALAKQGGSLQLPRYLGCWMLVRGNGSQHNKVVKRCLARLHTTTVAISALWGCYQGRPTAFVSWNGLCLYCCVHCAVCFVYNDVWDCWRRCYAQYL